MLEAPFVSAKKVGQASFTLFPVGMLLVDKFNSIGIIPSLSMPVLILYGTEDEVINPEHSNELYEKVASRKKIIEYKYRGHNDLDPEVMIRDVVKFYKKQ